MIPEHGGPGLLSSDQREYLIGNSDIEPQTANERNIRARIRKRLRNAILDFRVVRTAHSPKPSGDGDLSKVNKDQNLLINDIREDVQKNGEYIEGLYYTIGWAINLGTNAGIDRETIINEGVLRSDRDILQVKSDIEIQRRTGYTPGTVTEKLQQGEKPDSHEIAQAFINDELDDLHKRKLREIGWRDERNDFDLDDGASVWSDV
jgi:hypothetical protein